MDQGTLVEMQLDGGRRLIDRLVTEGVEVKAGAWIHESETGDWYHYLVTPLVSDDGATKQAYMRVNAVIMKMRKEGIWIEPLDIKVVAPSESVAQAVMAWRDRYPSKSPTRFRGHRLGELEVDEAFIYPVR